jgi:hypothetical protein
MLRKRNCGRLVGPEGFWFQLHRALNPIAAILTIIAFAIAVHVIREEDGKRLGRNTPISLLVLRFSR